MRLLGLGPNVKHDGIDRRKGNKQGNIGIVIWEIKFSDEYRETPKTREGRIFFREDTEMKPGDTGVMKRTISESGKALTGADFISRLMPSGDQPDRQAGTGAGTRGARRRY